MVSLNLDRSSLLLLVLGAAIIWGRPLAVSGRMLNQEASNVFTLDFQGRRDMVCTNLATGVQCTNPPPKAMNTAGYSNSHRNIISFDSNGIYALGFEQSKERAEAFYLAIYIWNPSDHSAGASIWRAKGLYKSTVDEKATLRFLRNGSLDLRSSKGDLVWTTGTDRAGATHLEFDLDVGNLALKNAGNTTVWESRFKRLSAFTS